MHGTCKLCRRHTKLENSHFRPRFIARWMKKTSITGYIRESLGDPRVNKRVQDLPKDYWLCGDCEDRFSAWEGKFASKIFYPFVDHGESTAYCGEWLLKFCVSLSWRTLTYIRKSGASKDDSDEPLLDLAERRWADYLLGKTDSLAEYEQHLIPIDVSSSRTLASGMVKVPSNFNRYMFRASVSSVAGNSDWLLAYTKLPKFIILGLIDSQTSMREAMKPSLIGEAGKLSSRSYVFPTDFHTYLMNKMNDLLEAGINIPQEEFDKHISKNPSRAAASNQFQAFLQDYRQFGDVVFKE